MNERIKKLRKALNLTQQEFAERIGSKRNTVANYETNRNEPSNSVVTLICREFNVDENWLRNGEGEMFKTSYDELSALVDKYNISDFGRTVIEKMVKLNEKQWNAVCDFMMEFMADLSKKNIGTSSVNNQGDEPIVATESKKAATTSQQINNSTETISVPKAEWEEMKRMLMEQQKQIDTINQEGAIRDLLERKSDLSTFWSK